MKSSSQVDLATSTSAGRPALNRRRFLLTGASSAGLAIAGHDILTRAVAKASDPFARLDATAQAELIRKREVAPRELLEAAIKRVEALNPQLNAIVTPLYELARTAAGQPLPDGPFAGVPFTIKDMVDLAGTRRTAGSRSLATNVSTETTEIVSRSLAAGLIVLGKTNMPEFALNATTESLLLGPARNPWDLSRSPGGSSGGAAVAVASGMIPLAHASDGGGSIRIPASCCGLFGLKPSRLRMVGSRPTDSGVENCVSRTVRDSATLFGWTQRQDAEAPLPPVPLVSGPSPRRISIGFSTRNIYGKEPEPEVRTAIEQTAKLCERLGHRIEPAQLPVNGEEFIQHFMVAWSGGAARVEQMTIAQGKKPEAILESWTLHLAAHARAQPPDAGAKASAYFADLARQFATFFASRDAMLSPVVVDIPPPLSYLGPAVDPAQLWNRLVKYVSYTPVHNIAGTPAISVPLGMSRAGLPIGSQFAARVGGERTLLELAFELEQAQPWADRWPALALR